MKTRIAELATGVLIVMLLSSCASMQRSWRDAEYQNSTQAYEAFIKAYPDSQLATEARKRIENEEYAFRITCQSGTIDAWQGFADSHPSSPYGQLANYRLAYLRGVKGGDAGSYKQFVDKNPNNPFVLEAISKVPVMWLRELSEDIGVIPKVDSTFAWRGLFKEKKTDDEIKREVFDKLHSGLLQEGIRTSLVEASPFRPLVQVSTVVEVHYREERIQKQYSTGAGLLHDGAVSNLTNTIAGLLGADIEARYSFAAKDAENDEIYFSDLPSLRSIVDFKTMLKCLARLSHDCGSFPTLMIASNNSDEEVQLSALTILARIKERQESEYARLTRVYNASRLADPVKSLGTFLDDVDWHKRMKAVDGLVGNCDTNVTKYLRHALVDQNENVRGRTAYVLRLGTDSASLGLLYVALEDRSSFVRGTAANSLGLRNDTTAIDRLISALQDSTFYVRQMALNALRTITRQDIEESYGKWQAWRTRKIVKLEITTQLVLTDIIVDSILSSTDVTISQLERGGFLTLDGKVEYLFDNQSTPNLIGNGARHRLKGRVEMSGAGFENYIFEGDETMPLTFTCIRGKGYVYEGGSGKVTCKRDSKVTLLGSESPRSLKNEKTQLDKHTFSESRNSGASSQNNERKISDTSRAVKIVANEFLAQNRKASGVVVLPSGLQYKALAQGKGRSPQPDETVEVHYRGTLVDGTEFDNSYKRGLPLQVRVNATLRGWTEALQLMSVGSKWMLFVPADLGYGSIGSGNAIPPNATLIFELELLSIKEMK